MNEEEKIRSGKLKKKLQDVIENDVRYHFKCKFKTWVTDSK